jgi:adenylate cyclase
VSGVLHAWMREPPMPARVARQVHAQQRESEILIGWVQAVLVSFFAVLYTVSRKTAPPDQFAVVPWTLAIYGAFTALRLWLAYRGRMRLPYQAASTVLDVTLLMLTIWVFHIQYGQPAAFYLKAPTLLYIFIFIALRSLSTSPGQVLFIGLAAALGWFALLAYALTAPGGIELVTRDYVAYMTSARILIGGEVDKAVSIVLVSLVLAVAAARSRRLLYRAVTEQAAALQLARFFPPEVASELISADELLKPGQGRQCEAAAMFVDLRGFTKLAARLAPQELIALLGEYQRLAVPVIRRHGGSIITYLGDGIMVTFGAPRPSVSFAADALRCAEGLLDTLGAWEAERSGRGLPAVGIGIGVDSGGVTSGVIGEEGRLEYAVIGDAVNRAAKLQNQTKAEGTRALTTAQTLSRAVAQGYEPARCAALSPARDVPGIAGTVDIVAIR